MTKASALYPQLENREMTGVKERKWAELSRNEKLASVLYPGHVSQSRRREMEEIAKGEGKRPPHGPGPKR